MIDPDTLEIKIIDYPYSYKNRLSTEHLEFCSPEALKSNEVSQATDLWSIGVIAYWLLNGTSPYSSPDASKMKNNIRSTNWTFSESQRLRLTRNSMDFINWFLEKDPLRRISVSEGLEHKFLNFSYKIDFDIDFPDSSESKSSNNSYSMDSFSSLDY